MADRLQELLSELQDEVHARGPSDEEREKLAEWFSGVLSHEQRKGERAASLFEMLGQGFAHGEDDDSEAPPAA